MNSRSDICKLGSGLPLRSHVACNYSPGYLKGCFRVFSDTFKIHFRVIVVSRLMVPCCKVFLLPCCRPLFSMCTAVAVTPGKQRWHTNECKGEVVRTEIHAGFGCRIRQDVSPLFRSHYGEHIVKL